MVANEVSVQPDILHLLQARTMRRVSSAFESLKIKKTTMPTRVNGTVVEVEAAAGRPAQATGRGDGAKGRRRSAVGNFIPANFSKFSRLNVTLAKQMHASVLQAPT